MRNRVYKTEKEKQACLFSSAIKYLPFDSSSGRSANNLLLYGKYFIRKINILLLFQIHTAIHTTLCVKNVELFKFKLAAAPCIFWTALNFFELMIRKDAMFCTHKNFRTLLLVSNVYKILWESLIRSSSKKSN